MLLLLVLLGLIAFIVVATSVWRIHPFIALMIAAIGGGLLFGLPLVDVQDAEGEPVAGITSVVASGFGGILGGIGLVIIFGTIIGVILEKSGAAITIAETIVKLLGGRFPTLTMSLIGFFVSIPVFCDSGFVILNSMKESLSRRMAVSPVAMSVAMATGLYATHTFVPPTPGPIAAAGNLDFDNLGLVMLVGLPIALTTALVGTLWARRFVDEAPEAVGPETGDASAGDGERLDSGALVEAARESYGTLPSPFMSFAPIGLPVVLIMLASIVKLPSRPLGESGLVDLISLLGQPVVALALGLAVATALLKGADFLDVFRDRVSQGITACAPILLITGAGGSFGSIIKATSLRDDIAGLDLSDVGILMPFLLAAALKSAQGSSTTAMVVTSSILAPLVGQLGLDSDLGLTLTVMAIGAGAMTVSHANDSYFWVVAQFSRMSVSQAYRTQTLATLAQGLTGIAVVYGASLALL